MHIQAYNKKGFPKDEDVFHNTEGFVVRHGDVKPPEDMRGGDLQLGCCPTSVRNVCVASLRAESEAAAKVYQQALASLTGCADFWGKVKCNKVEALLMIRISDSSGVVSSHFALMVRAWFSPKWHLWAICEAIGSVVDFPYTIQLAEEHGRLCPGTAIPKIRTTAELAKQIAMATVGGQYELFELDYHMPSDTDHLLTMVVQGMTPMGTRVAKPQTRNRALQELRSALGGVGDQGDLVALGARRGGARPVPKGRGIGRGGRPSRGRPQAQGAARGEQENVAELVDRELSDNAPALDNEDGGGAEVALAGEVEQDPFDDLGPDDVLEVVTAYKDFVDGDDDGAPAAATGVLSDDAGCDAIAPVVADDGVAEMANPAASSHEQASATGAAAAAGSNEAPPPPPPQPEQRRRIKGPSGLGYFRDLAADRDIARISEVFTNNSVSVTCSTQSKCRVAMAEWKLPSREDLVAWVANAQPVLRAESAAQKKEKATKPHGCS